LLTGNVTKKKPQKIRKTNNTSLIVKKSDTSLTLELKKAEERVQKLEVMRQNLDIQLSDPDIYSPTSKERLYKLEIKDKELKKAIKLAEKIWLDISEKIEGL
jgi:ATP-binding cassette subfamily F protein 3